MSDFDRFFETPHLTSREVGFFFGCPSVHTWTIKRFGMMEAYDPREGRKIPKPIVWLEELAQGKKYIFLNTGSFKALRERFGPGFDDDKAVIGQLVTVSIAFKTIDGSEVPTITLCHDEYPDQRAKLGKDRADRMVSRVAAKMKRAVGQDEIVKMITNANPDLGTSLTSIERVEDWPVATVHALARHFKSEEATDG